MRFIIFLGLCISSLHAWAQPVEFKVNPAKISVSGLSSGAYMAHQLHVAYSNTFMGAGLVAGGPFFCAENMEILGTLYHCLEGRKINYDRYDEKDIKEDVQIYIDKAIETSKIKLSDTSDETLIDDPNTGLSGDKVFIFNSRNDQVVNPILGKLTLSFYNKFSSAPSDHLVFWDHIEPYGTDYRVAHGMPSGNDHFNQFKGPYDFKKPCEPLNTSVVFWAELAKIFPDYFSHGDDPWLYNCFKGTDRQSPGFDLAKEILSHIYGPVESSQELNEKSFYSFKQASFISGLTENQSPQKYGLGETGYAYVPKACQQSQEGCKLHVALHGCNQFPEWSFKSKLGSANQARNITFGDLFYKHIYNDLAESNDIIMIYPQAHSIENTNPFGCWSFWGFTGEERDTYYNKKGRQMQMIKAIVDDFVKGSIPLKPL